MTALYAESSAVLQWLLKDASARRVERELRKAKHVVTSALTLAEVDRTLHRLTAAGALSLQVRERAAQELTQVSGHWEIHSVSNEVLARVRAPFPSEPVRTLDAIHLATASLYAVQVRAVAMLSLDERIRTNARLLGLALAPAGARGYP